MGALRRSVIFQLLAAALTAAAAVAATYYLDEDFDEGTLPAGWQARTSGNGRAYYTFERRGGGYYFYAGVEARSEEYAAVELTSPQFTAPPGTLYYRFDFTSYSYGSATAGKHFAVKYVGSTTNIIYEILPANSSWHVEAGSFYVGEAKPIVAIWDISVGAAPGRYGSGSMGLDDVAIADNANIAVAPASLGRVKALFR